MKKRLLRPTATALREMKGGREAALRVVMDGASFEADKVDVRQGVIDLYDA